MYIETIYKHVRYLLSNEDLKVGDEVFPCGSGRRLENGSWALHYLEFDKMKYTNFKADFPDTPHTIEKIEKDYIHTNMGYSFPQVYYKIIKKEKQVVDREDFPKSYKWIEI